MFDQWESGGEYIGGISGIISSGIVSKCFSNGTIKGAKFMGGLIGKNQGTVSNSYAIVSIYDETDYYGAVSLAESLGGFTGYSSGSISYCYSTGFVDSGYNSGGFAGVSTGTVSSCFWDVNTSGRATSAGGEGKTTVEMKTLSTFTDAGWDFATYWAIDPLNNDGYPHLDWEYPSGIENNETVLSDFALFQNYPNPFNPMTTISYVLPSAAQVELNVYNLQGQLVQSLVNGKQDKGMHKTEFNGADLTSGMYAYNLKVDGKVVQSKKMLLLK
jgi:hypothetical protein